MVSFKVIASLFSIISFATAVSPPRYYVSITGVKSGPVYPDKINNTDVQILNSAIITSFSFSGITARDTATGALAGKVQYNPITITKKPDASSIMLMKVFHAQEPVTVLVTMVEDADSAHRTTKLQWKLNKGAIAKILYDGSVETLGFTFKTADFMAFTAVNTAMTTITW